jgi:hypothetical protein
MSTVSTFFLNSECWLLSWAQNLQLEELLQPSIKSSLAGNLQSFWRTRVEEAVLWRLWRSCKQEQILLYTEFSHNSTVLKLLLTLPTIEFPELHKEIFLKPQFMTRPIFLFFI